MSRRSSRPESRGTAVSVIAAKTKLERSPEGQHGQVVAPTPEAVRAAIEACLCPFCGRGPFKVLALHVSQRHGIDRYELRDLAGLPKNSSVCSPEYSEVHRELLVGRGGIRPKTSPGNRRPQQFSRAGREAKRRVGQALGKRERTPADREVAKANGAKRGAQLRKPRQPCAVCGGEIPFVPSKTQTKTCSPACRTELKSRNMSAARRSGRL